MSTAVTLKQYWGTAAYILIGGGWMLAVLWLAARYTPGPQKRSEDDADKS